MKLMKPYLGKGRTVATDNYFTSLSLANRLLESNTTLLGTINKIRREIPLEAKNAKGREKLSTEVYRSDAGLWKQFAVWGTVGVGSALVLSLITAAVCLQRKRGAEGGADVQAPKCGDDTYSALNPNARSSDYDTLTQVRDSASDTYSALNSTTRSSDYDTLTVVRPHPAMRRAPENEN
ncbi:hypothetical protein SRHO_G00104180 [Serrasalmus rhombeus]